MCGIVGFVNYKKDINNPVSILNEMNHSLTNRGPVEEESYISSPAYLARKKLAVVDPISGSQPMITTYNENEYSIVCNGQIYNTLEIKDTLIENGFYFKTNSDIEVLLNAFIFYGYDIVKHINGNFAFAIWNKNKEELFLARDHFGIKPLFYTITDDTLVFASELKSIFKFPNVEKILDTTGICELFGIGPAHTSGTTVFKNIFELQPAHFAIFNKYGFFTNRYWKFISKPHLDSFNETCMKVKFLLEDSIKNNLVSEVPFCSFLSGGLDSSIITAYASKYCNDNGLPTLKTFSVDYLDNDKNFVKSDFQPNSDNYYINLMVEKYKTNHTNIILDTPDLANYLEDSMIARDVPGMADVDSSLLLFCKNVKPYATVALSGECADEIFGGYPWFFRDDALNSNTFPWSIALSERQHLLHTDISKKINLKEYIDFRYNESLANVEILDTDSKETAEKRKISYLTLNWFMQTLLDRSDRCSMYNDFEIRVPFCDYKLAEYVWNIPWEMKAYKGREKGLLRHIMKDILPSEIINRKKSPYPKTHNPTYLKAVKNMLTKIMNNSSSPINNILNRSYILEILESNGSAFTKPWFGQLMTGPQLMAYLCQVNMWLEKYEPRIEM